MQSNSSAMALDVGDRRIGVAVARHDVRVATPVRVIDRQAEDVWEALNGLIKEYDVDELVVGLPRGLEGQETAQTAATRLFADELSERVNLEPNFQDEALTSKVAEHELQTDGVKYSKGDVDVLAAVYILTDYINEKTSQSGALA